MKESRNILNLLALNRFMIRNREFNPEHAAPIFSNSVLNISNDTLISFFRRLNEQQIKYLVSGGIATAYHGHVQPVSEVEIWLSMEEDNVGRFCNLLKIEKFQSPLTMMYMETSTNEDFKLFIFSNLSSFKAADFETCYDKREQAMLQSVLIPILNLNDLLTEKIAAGRPEDKPAIHALEKIHKLSESFQTHRNDQ